MDVSYVNSFIQAIDGVFATMFSLKPKRTGLQVNHGAPTGTLITSLVGISGEVSGVVALRFPPSTALKLAGKLLGSEPNEINDEVTDAVAELVNMVAGSAKAKFECDPPLQLGLPTVVYGTGYKLRYPSKSVLLDVTFDSDAGEFTLEVTYSPE